MSQRAKQILLIILLFAGAALIAFALYFVFFRSIPSRPTTDELPTDVTTTPGILPTAQVGQPTVITPTQPGDIGITTGLPDVTGTEIAQGVVTQTTNLTQEEIGSIALSSNGNDVSFYNENDGRFYRINELGETTLLSDEEFNNVEDVDWAPDASKGILTYPDGTKQYYNFQTREKATLPNHWEDFSFDPGSNQIAFKETNDNADFEWLSIANPDGTGKQAIEHLGINTDRVKVTWSPSNEIVGHYWEGAATDRTILYFIGKNNENLKATFVEGYNVESKWNNNGEQLLYSAISSKDDFNPRLWIVNARGNTIGSNRIDLGLNTFAEKCTFVGSETAYCAVPESLERGAGLQKDVALDVPDTIWKIDLTTGQKSKVAETDINANINQMVVSEDESNIFFTDSETNNLHKLRLK